MSDLAASARPMRTGYWGTLLFMVLYFVAAVACLRQWGTPHPWSRIDAFSGGFLLLSIVWGAATMRFHRAIFRSREVMREASGVTYDRWMLRWITIFAVAELTVYLDYGHWHLVPALEKPALQAIGLGLYLLSSLNLIWTDRYLSRQFSGELTERWVMDEGPYHYVRHPRYASLILARAAFALALASILAWFFAAGWLIVNLRRIRREEAHLHGLFGAEYDAYAKRTARLFPGIY